MTFSYLARKRYEKKNTVIFFLVFLVAFLAHPHTLTDARMCRKTEGEEETGERGDVRMQTSGWKELVGRHNASCLR